MGTDRLSDEASKRRLRRTAPPFAPFSDDGLVGRLLRITLSDLTRARLIWGMARIGLLLVSQKTKDEIGSLSETEREELERRDLHPGRIEAFESYLRTIDIREIDRVGVVMLAVAMEEFLGTLIAEALIAQAVGSGFEDPAVTERVAEHMQEGFRRQLTVIEPVVHLEKLRSFPEYREMRATRNMIVHNGGRVNQLYLRDAGALARGAFGDELPVDEAYIEACFDACRSLLGEMIENYYALCALELGIDKKAITELWPRSSLSR